MTTLTLKGGVKVGMLYTDIEVGSKAEHLGAAETGGVSRLPWTADTLLAHIGLHQKGFETPELATIRGLLYWKLSVFSSGITICGGLTSPYIGLTQVEQSW